MNVLWVIIRREYLQLMRSAHGLLPLFFALGAFGAIFCSLLRRAEGSAEIVPALWGLAASFGLPFIASVAASRGFTQDRERGMMRLMFATPVPARCWVLGKVVAAWLLCMIYILGAYVIYWVMARWVLPMAQLPGGWYEWCLSAGMMALQAWLWCSIGIAVSLLTKSSAATVFLSLFCCTLLPSGVYLVLAMFWPACHAQWPLIPLQEQIYDASMGLLDVRIIIGYLSVSCVFIYIAGLIYDAMRLIATER